MSEYGRVAPPILDELRRLVGSEHALIDPESLQRCARDETEDLAFRPDVVVRPDTADQVGSILKLASRERIPVTPRGAGTGLSGGALPVRGGICLSMERMNRILEIDEANMMAVVEPGVITETLQTQVEKVGLCYPPDPASRGSSMIGGNVAENAGGPRAVKYGVTKDWVAGLSGLLADGRAFSTGGKLRKDASGYNLTGLLVGSEGTLAVITRVVLRLIPLPSARRALVACYPDLDSAARGMLSVLGRGFVPSAVELMEGAAWRAGADRVGDRSIPPDHGAYLLVEVDGSREEVVEEEARAAGEACLDSGASDVLAADSPTKQRKVWAVRRAIGEAVKGIAPYKEEDTVVPRAQVPEFLRSLRGILDRHGLEAICYGHAGDGNIHVNLLRRGGLTAGPRASSRPSGRSSGRRPAWAARSPASTG